MKVWYVYGKQCYIKSTLIGIYALVVFVSEMSLFRLLIRQQLVRVKNRIRAQFPRSILCMYMLQIKIKFRLKFFNSGLFSISLMWYGCILYTSHIKLCTVAMFKIHKIDSSARLYMISGHLVLLWLSTGSCWNSKADGHWQKQTMNLPRSGTDRSGYVHQWSPMRWSLTAGNLGTPTLEQLQLLQSCGFHLALRPFSNRWQQRDV